MFRTNPGTEIPFRPTRTLEIGERIDGWYFTVRQGDFLLFSSASVKDRGEATVQGIKYLDFLNDQDYEIARQQKEKRNGQ